jgi:hypothetical protein
VIQSWMGMGSFYPAIQQVEISRKKSLAEKGRAIPGSEVTMSESLTPLLRQINLISVKNDLYFIIFTVSCERLNERPQLTQRICTRQPLKA